MINSIGVVDVLAVLRLPSNSVLVKSLAESGIVGDVTGYCGEVSNFGAGFRICGSRPTNEGIGVLVVSVLRGLSLAIGGLGTVINSIGVVDVLAVLRLPSDSVSFRLHLFIPRVEAKVIVVDRFRATYVVIGTVIRIERSTIVVSFIPTDKFISCSCSPINFGIGQIIGENYSRVDSVGLSLTVLTKGSLTNIL